MSFQADIPHFFCWMRAEYAYDMKSHVGEYFSVMVFGVDSVAGHAVGFDVVTDFGAMFARLPISALVHKKDAPELPLDWLELWNCFSYSVEAHESNALHHSRCAVLMKNKKWSYGEYMFTLSWFGNNWAEDPGEGGFKRGQVIKLDDGNYCIQPNNRIKWFDPSFITKKFPEKPDFLTNSHIWNCEGGNWVTSDDEKFFYDIEQKQVSAKV